MPDSTLSMDTPVIPSLVARHAGDAAFYWSQLDSSAYSPIVGLAQLAQLDRLLAAHLDGLRVAGAAGWIRALGELTRWKGAGEAFVCTLLALESNTAGPRLKAVWDVAQQDPQRMLRGLISAFAWVDEHHARPWLEHWLNDSEVPSALQTVAWRASRLRHSSDWITPEQMETALTSSHAQVRAAACRLLSRVEHRHHIDALLRDSDYVVRGEAAISGAAASYASCVPVLEQSVTVLTREYKVLTGRQRRDAQRRLDRWTRHLGLIISFGHPAIDELLAELPPRQALLFILHHGDCAHLPAVVAYLDHPEAARLAGWVWAMLSGVDLERAGLCYPPTPLDGAPRPTDDFDFGLPIPSSERIATYPLNISCSPPALLGSPLTAERLSELLHNAPQALRWIASQRFAQCPSGRFDSRAKFSEQLSQMHLMFEQVA